MDFCEEVETLLGDKKYDQLEKVIFNPDNQPKIQAFGMDLITRVCECGLAFCSDFDSLRIIQDVLMHVVKTIRAKEALIGLLEQAEIFVKSESNKFSSLLAPLQHVMISLPKKREHSFSWVLSTLNSHVKSRHQLPAKLRKRFVRGKEAFLLEENPKVKDMLLTYKEYCNFYEPFIKQFYIDKMSVYSSSETDAVQSIQRQQTILRDHLVQLLGGPFLHFNLHWEEPENETVVKTDARLIAERLMGFLRVVDQNPEYYCGWSSMKLFIQRTNKLKSKPIYIGDDNESDESDSDDTVVEFNSVINYYYLVFVEKMNDDIMPSVLSPVYLFISTARLVSPLLSDTKAGPMSLLKCFTLCRKLISKLDASLPGLRLESELLETTLFGDFIDSVAYHTVYCETLEVRKNGLEVLKHLLWKFEPKGRYDYILLILNRIQHDGVKGYIITQLKDCIRVALDLENPEMKEYFTGKSLLKQLRLTCTLKNGVTTDLFDNKEQIMSALNLVLYLTIRDKTQNVTGIHEAVPEIEKKLLEPLFKGLELSRAHYQLKLKELDDPKVVEDQLKEHKKLAGSMDVTLNNDPISPLASFKEQKEAMTSALGLFDIMNGTLARVSEFCDVLRKSQKGS